MLQNQLLTVILEVQEKTTRIGPTAIHSLPPTFLYSTQKRMSTLRC